KSSMPSVSENVALSLLCTCSIRPRQYNPVADRSVHRRKGIDYEECQLVLFHCFSFIHVSVIAGSCLLYSGSKWLPHHQRQAKLVGTSSSRGEFIRLDVTACALRAEVAVQVACWRIIANANIHCR
ncbi:MAG: hypothetical protein QXP01_07420, partial [Candidatus Hadarchaeum sp.]